MAKLYLKFEQAVLKECPLTQGTITIGRLPDNLIQIDNLAVSGHHCKIYWDTDHYVIEDNNSLNGTYVNNQRINKAILKDGDAILVGKHVVQFKDEWHEDAPAEKTAEKTVPMMAGLDATMVMGGKAAAAAMSKTVPPGTAAAAAAPARERIGLVRVMDGKTDESQYVLSSKLTVIGKSDMASIKLKGWFAPKVAANIMKRDGSKYFIAAAEKDVKVSINGEQISGQRELQEGDTVEVAGLTLQFIYQE